MTDRHETSATDGLASVRFDEIRVARVESLENCLAGCSPESVGLPLLGVQVTFDLAELLAGGGPQLRRNQYAGAWELGRWHAEAFRRLSARGLLLPHAMTWDGHLAVGFELCERLSPLRQATRLKGMRVRPLRTYLVLVTDPTYTPTPSGKCWLKVTAGANSVRPFASRVHAVA